MNKHRAVRFLFSWAILLWTTAHVRGDVIEIDATIASGLFATGFASPHHMNYYIGYSIPSTPVERRNFFVFPIPSLDASIVSAKLKLYLPGPPSLPSGYISSEPTEEYRISGSPFPVDGFVGAFMGSPAITPPMISAMYGTLGGMPPFGLAVISGDLSGSDVVIDLTPEGIAALNASLGMPIVIGGRLTDIHPEMPGMPPSELVFAYTDVGAHPDIVMPRLELTTIPEPTSTFVGGLVLLFGIKRWRMRLGISRSDHPALFALERGYTTTSQLRDEWDR